MCGAVSGQMVAERLLSSCVSVESRGSLVAASGGRELGEGSGGSSCMKSCTQLMWSLQKLTIEVFLDLLLFTIN